MKERKFIAIKWVLLLVCLPFLNSCDWEDLPTYEEAEISAVQFYYRLTSDNEKDPITQEPVVKEVRLNTTSEVNSESATIHVTVTVPEAGWDFTLGSPDDWSTERKFSVKAANGNTKIWTIKIVQLNK